MSISISITYFVKYCIYHILNYKPYQIIINKENDLNHVIYSYTYQIIKVYVSMNLPQWVKNKYWNSYDNVSNLIFVVCDIHILLAKYLNWITDTQMILFPNWLLWYDTWFYDAILNDPIITLILPKLPYRHKVP
jgi:hypothetical protein